MAAVVIAPKPSLVPKAKLWLWIGSIIAPMNVKEIWIPKLYLLNQKLFAWGVGICVLTQLNAVLQSSFRSVAAGEYLKGHDQLRDSEQGKDSS